MKTNLFSKKLKFAVVNELWRVNIVEFILGVNYWASNAGADMWRNWNEEIVDRDLEILSQYGVKYLRVFPNWRDFQPVELAFGQGHKFVEYRMSDDRYPENTYYLDEVMLERFHRFCKIAQKHGMKLIVGLITGWMSGRLYIPNALVEKNIYTDATALYLQQLFIKGFVSEMMEESSIYAWDLGNECNCMDVAEKREEAYSWSAVIVNAIKACDAVRPVVSGMHSLELEGVWNIQDQGEITDILTTHPYPLWVEHCSLTSLTSFRTLLHATAQTQYYATAGKKPCLVEEIGSMGPMIASEEHAAEFLKVNLWSNWANGATGVMWWCANEQSSLTAAPYDWNMCERELGMLTVDMQPKPTLLAMKQFSEEQKKLGLTLPKRKTDTVCILSKGQDHWGIAYMSYILAKQAGITMDFAYCEEKIPDSQMYFLPSTCMSLMSKRSYDALKKKVAEGATLYISTRDAFFTEFPELTGFTVEYSQRAATEGEMSWLGNTLHYEKPYQLRLKSTGAKVLLADEQGNPMFGFHKYGKGSVYFLNFPMEEMLLTKEQGFESPYYTFYAAAAVNVLSERGILKRNPYVGMTLHEDGKEIYGVLVNYSDQSQKPGIILGVQYIDMETIYGCVEEIEPFGTTIIKITSGKNIYDSCLDDV